MLEKILQLVEGESESSGWGKEKPVTPEAEGRSGSVSTWARVSACGRSSPLLRAPQRRPGGPTYVFSMHSTT